MNFDSRLGWTFFSEKTSVQVSAVPKLTTVWHTMRHFTNDTRSKATVWDSDACKNIHMDSIVHTSYRLEGLSRKFNVLFHSTWREVCKEHSEMWITLVVNRHSFLERWWYCNWTQTMTLYDLGIQNWCRFDVDFSVSVFKPIAIAVNRNISAGSPNAKSK